MSVEINDLMDIFNQIKSRIRNKRKVYHFEKNKMSYLYYIKKRFESNEFVFGKYNVFLIRKPKTRVIMSTGIMDKIIERYLNENILLKNLECLLLDENVATRKGLGVTAAIKRLKYGIEKHKKYDDFYILKLDIKQFFYSIDHEILKKLLKEKLSQVDYEYVEKIIDSTDEPYINEKIRYYEKKYNIELPKYDNGKGISIGNVMSQFFAVFYLYKLHHYIKHNLHIKHFVVYMDDYILIHQDKAYLKYCLQEIIKILKEYKLEINPNKTHIVNAKHGISFLGYNIKVKDKRTIVTMSRKSIDNIKSGIKRNKYLYENEYIDEAEYFASMMNYKKAYPFTSNKKNEDIISYLG